MSIENAQQRLNDASTAYLLAAKAEAEARAAFVRESLLALGEKYPVILGFDFETEWSYDDEGGYFPTASIYAKFADSNLEMEYELEDALVELGNDLTHEAIEILGDSLTIRDKKG